MDDNISRQAAIDAKQEFRNPNVVSSTEARTAYDRTYANGWNDCNSAWIDAINALPCAQPEVRTQMSSADCISRQALCEYALNQKDKCITPNDIMRFPSVQPEPEEFEWCTDCKEYDQAQHCCHRWTKVIRQTVEEIKAEQPERKQGKWIKVHGFCTPGGDPVWACSECGKGVHVYGIEHGTYGADVSDGQWKACPNCGARMDGEEHD